MKQALRRLIVGILLVLTATASAQDSVGDQQDEFDRMFREQSEEFNNAADAMLAEWNAWTSADSIAFENFRERVIGKWDNYRGSTDKNWVEYSPDMNSRTDVDFETGEVTVEVLVPASTTQAQRESALQVATVALAEDPGKSMDYSVLDEHPAPLLDEPVLSGQLMPAGVTPEAFAEELVSRAVIEERPAPKSADVKWIRLSITTALVPDHLRIRAEQFLDLVHEYANRNDLDPRLVLAVIQTESYFNPKARSHVPAFGLMQLVPTSGGRDAYSFVTGTDQIPSPNYLYDPARNIELGCAYLALIRDRYLRGIDDMQSRLYCTISAYNTGAGNVSRAFTGNTRIKPAVDRINSMNSDEVLTTLRRQLPHMETRRYIQDVLDRARYYEEWKTKRH